jgi:Kef-type K+ transport system membrane component KefB
MPAWWAIAYGAALSAVLAVVLVVLLAKQRQPAVLATVALGAVVGPVAWNAILRATHADQFFRGAPIIVFPISWQDTGSAVFAFAALSLLLGFGPLRNGPGRRVAGIATLGALAALLVEIFLY